MVFNPGAIANCAKNAYVDGLRRPYRHVHEVFEWTTNRHLWALILERQILSSPLWGAGTVVIPNTIGESLTPSVAGVDDSGTILVGAAAREYQVMQPERCASLFKRYMGTDWKRTIDGRDWRPEELSALVLRSLIEDAEVYLEKPVDSAVITVPAYCQ